MIWALIDTNVNIDNIIPNGNAEDGLRANLIVRRHEEKQFRGYVSASAITDIYYIVAKRKKADVALKAVERIANMYEILPVDRKIIEEALDSSMKDFEDAVQAVAAKTMNVNIVVTRDQTGYTDSGMTVFTPQEFLEYLDNQQPV